MARIVVSILLVGLAGCQSIALSLVGAGAGTALRYGFDGVAYRTFTAGAGATAARSLRTGVTNLTAAEAKPPPLALD
jgi:hypothetical protein